MTTPWVLLLTDDPHVAAAVVGLADAAGVATAGSAAAGAGPPALVVLGADRIADPTVPTRAASAPRILVGVDPAAGPVADGAAPPGDGLWRAALDLRAEQVLLLPGAEPALRDRLLRVARRGPQRALVIAVTGGCGGAGASVLAAALARTAARLRRTMLVEVDRMGSGADLLLGAEDEPGLRWPDLLSVRGRLLPDSLVGALPVVDGVHVLSWDRAPVVADLPPPACVAVLDAAVAECGVVVLDLPRRLDPAAAVCARGADLGLLVVPAEVRAAAAAHRVAAGLREHVGDVRLVVRGPVTSGLSAEAVGDALDLPLAAVLRPEPGLRAGLDRGEPPGVRERGPLATLCRLLLAGELAGPAAAARRAS